MHTTSDHYRSVFRPGLFEGQVHWVTGGGSGDGRCVAHELASVGATVVLSGCNQDKLDRVASEVSAALVSLLSAAAAFITGVTLQIDGAASLGSEIFPLGSEAKSVLYDGFHRAVTPAVLK